MEKGSLLRGNTLFLSVWSADHDDEKNPSGFFEFRKLCHDQGKEKNCTAILRPDPNVWYSSSFVQEEVINRAPNPIPIMIPCQN
jgi:hypothetical protein